MKASKKRLRKVSKASSDARRSRAKVSRLRTLALDALKAARKDLQGVKRSALALAAKYGKALTAASDAVARYEPQAPVVMPTIDDGGEELAEAFGDAVETQLAALESYAEDVGASG